jgi:hypothetical protein
LARLGSAYDSERDEAVAELTTSADASMVAALMKLLAAGQYPTVRAAAAALARAPSIKAAAAPALKALLERTAGKQPATRLGLHLRALHSVAPEEGAAVTRALLRRAASAGDQPLLTRVAEALAEPAFASDTGLVRAALPELRAALAKADAAALEAIGSAMGQLDLEPDALTPAVGDLIATMRRTKPAPFTIQRALLLALERCDDEALFRQAAAFVLEIWPKPTHRGWDGSTLFHLAVLKLCPGKVAQVALPKLVAWPGRDAEIFRRIGKPALEALADRYGRGDTKDAKRALELIRRMGPEGEKAAESLEKGEPWPPIR